jgi:hypothetical protein
MPLLPAFFILESFPKLYFRDSLLLQLTLIFHFHFSALGSHPHLKPKPNLANLTPHISPHKLITTSKFGTSFPRYPVFVFSIFRTTSMPSTTLPKTTCLPSRKWVGTVVMKNCEPLPLGPAFCGWFLSLGWVMRSRGMDRLGKGGKAKDGNGEKDNIQP